jgi:uncharacterized protein (TIGR00251 family)
VRIQVKVKPNARTSSLVQASDGSWSATLKAPPADGQANAELIALVARQFGCARSAVSIRAGGASRSKWVAIDAAAED